MLPNTFKSPVIPLEPVKELLPDIIIEPMSVCISEVSSPKIFDPDENITDADSIVVTNLNALIVPLTIKSFVINALDAVIAFDTTKLPVRLVVPLTSKLPFTLTLSFTVTLPSMSKLPLTIKSPPTVKSPSNEALPIELR